MNETIRKPFMPPSREALTADYRRSFVRAATAAVLSQIQQTTTDAILREWPADRNAELILRGSVEPLKAAGLPGGAVAKLMLLAPKSAAAKLFEQASKVDLTGISQFSFPLPTSFTEAQFVEEGEPISVGEGVFTGMPLGPVKKIALIAALTNELERASAGVASVIISHVLEVAVGRGLDKKIFSADAATVAAPAGLLNGALTVTPVAGSGPAAMGGDVSNLVAKIAESGIDTSAIVFIASPAQAMALALTSGPNFNHRVASANIPDKTVIAVASSGLAAAGDGGVPRIDTSKHTTLHMAAPASPISAAGSPNVVAAPTRNMDQTDSFALRCIARITWAAAPGSVAFVSGVTW